MNRWKRKNKLAVYQQQMEAFDVQAYLRSNEFPEDMPEPLKQYTQKLVDGCFLKSTDTLARQQYQYSALQSQINPHFLYNTLESIRSEALMNQAPSIAEMTERLSRFFRYCISNQADIITLRDEIRNLKDYFYIQQYRFGNRFSLEINLDDEKALESHMPKMVLQPLVENAIGHGLESKKNGGCVSIDSILTSNTLYLWIRDNGIGMSQQQLLELNERLKHPSPSQFANARHKGIALTNINTRIQLQFGQEYGIRVTSVEGRGTDVEIRLPYIDTLTFEKKYKKDNKEEWKNY